MNGLVASGFAHLGAGRLADAETVCTLALEQDATDADAWRLYGLLAERAGKIDYAIECLGKAAALRPGVAEVHYELGNVLRIGGKLDLAIGAYGEALRLRPNYCDALINLGIALANSGSREKAAAAWEAALKLNPNDADAWANLGNLYRLMGRLEESIRCSQRAIELGPDRASTISNLGVAYEQQGRLDEAIDCYRRALALSPRAMYTHSNLLMDLTYHGSIAPEEVFAEHRRWNDIFAKPHAAAIAPHVNDRDPNRKLRIGYVSPDFREHAIAFFMEPVLAHVDREKFEIYCYSAAPHADAVTTRLQDLVPNWRNIVGVRDAQVAEMVRADGIDILIDLSVHTAGHRLMLFARKPAPVQATWLGYAGTTGLDAIDWRITDAIVDPLGSTESLHSERLMRLPRTQWVYQPPGDAPDVAPPPLERNGFVTFGNGTNLAKVTPQVIELWAKVLLSVPGSRLALKARSFTDQSTRHLFAGAFARHGVGRERLSFEGGGDLRDYLNFFATVDICLDTFPFAGGTTTCHTLWMGVPVVTLVGRTSVSRVGASVLTNVGLAELIAASPEEFVSIARSLAGDAPRLRDWRTRLRSLMRSSPLCDPQGFARDLELAYRSMWAQWCAA
jgi:protein O-GlcNAc transferase